MSKQQQRLQEINVQYTWIQDHLSKLSFQKADYRTGKIGKRLMHNAQFELNKVDASKARSLAEWKNSKHPWLMWQMVRLHFNVSYIISIYRVRDEMISGLQLL